MKTFFIGRSPPGVVRLSSKRLMKLFRSITPWKILINTAAVKNHNLLSLQIFTPGSYKCFLFSAGA
jgi:hypothetical protein